MKSTIKATRLEKRRSLSWALLPLLLLAAPATGCIVVEEEDICYEGQRECHGDYAEECFDNEWVVIEDCYDLCGGSCVYLDDEPACLC